MKIVVASDSFKGSLSAFEVGEAVKKGIHRYSEKIIVENFPMADGGEGTVETLISATNGQKVYVKVSDPLMRKIDSYYGISGDGKTAFIEIATASGLPLLEINERNPLVTTTYGTGEMIKDALDRGCNDFVIGLGGSATNDGGFGMLRALGVKFFDENNVEIKSGGGGVLSKVRKISTLEMDTRISKYNFSVACDVKNPFCGKVGATYVYGPQKGATPSMLALLDDGLRNYANCIKEQVGEDILYIEGSGAAGGLGGAFVAFFNSNLTSGVKLVIEKSKLADAIKNCNLVITGEGRIDNQTIYGKTPHGVATISKKYGKPVIAICGGIGKGTEILYENGFDSIFSITDGPMSVEKAMENASELISDAAFRVIKLFMLRKQKIKD